MSDCTCIHTEWNADRTQLINTFEADPSCPRHGGDALEGPNRWAAFTDDELHNLTQWWNSAVHYDADRCGLISQIEAELEARAARETP